MSESKPESRGSVFSATERAILLFVNTLVFALVMSDLIKPGSVMAFFNELFRNGG